jgi:hypothetical protein
VVSSNQDNPLRQLAAAWDAAATVATEWVDRTAAITAEAFHKLATDPAVRAVLESWRISPLFARRDCDCDCARTHPADVGVCDQHAVITRHLSTDATSGVDVRLCAPCAVAQGVAELA